MFDRQNKTQQAFFGPFNLTNHAVIDPVSTSNKQNTAVNKEALINSLHNTCTAGRIKLALAGEKPAGESQAANEPHAFKGTGGGHDRDNE